MTTLPSTTLTVDPQWIDSYGHMNAAHYVGVFDRIGFELLGQFGVGHEYTRTARCGIYTMNIQVAYMREVLAGDPLMLRVRILESDDKRLLALMELWQTRDDYLAATMEQLSLHVDLQTRKARPFAPELAARLARAATDHAGEPLPPGYRRILPLKRPASL
ncbi:thioesterase family protein [Bordetella genomosp. 13]|uniref:thioesterase family protein n=1 Tax=Bordetella genomosp. 13 TaxID=463040 RepID=UPI0011A55985|nr:thioesterase family protein [Bordetella genomosp. 13]